MIELLLYLPLVIVFFFFGFPFFFPLANKYWILFCGNLPIFGLVLRMKLRVDDESVVAKES